MKTEQDTAPSWLPDLFRQVEEELQKLTAGRHDHVPLWRQSWKILKRASRAGQHSLLNQHWALL